MTTYIDPDKDVVFYRPPVNWMGGAIPAGWVLPLLTGNDLYCCGCWPVSLIWYEDQGWIEREGLIV